MSAPASAYLLIDFKFRGSNGVLQIVNPAKAQADLATLKARFYLDDIIGFKAVYAGVEYHGFWGVVLPSGYNYDHHKPSRLLEINSPQTGKILRTLNDAGLNTLGDASTPIMSSDLSVGKIRISNMILKSAYYLISAYNGIKVSVNGGAEGVFSFDIYLNLNTSISNSFEVVLPENYYKSGDFISIRGYIINDEGTYLSNITSFTASLRSLTSKYSSSYASTAKNSGATVTIYLTTGRDPYIGDIIYSDNIMSTRVDNGYYYFNMKWYRFGPPAGETATGTNETVTSIGDNGSWPSDDPLFVPEYTIFNFNHFEPLVNGASNACFNVNNSPNAITLYRAPTSLRFYKYNNRPISSNILCENGYYVFNSGSEYYQINSGSISTTGAC